MVVEWGKVLSNAFCSVLSVFLLKEPLLCVQDEASGKTPLCGLTRWSLSYALEMKAGMWLLFSTAGTEINPCGCKMPLSLVMEDTTWLHSHAKTTIKSPHTTQNIVRPTPGVPSYTAYLCIMFTSQIMRKQVILRIHPRKNKAVDKNQNGSGKELS